MRPPKSVRNRLREVGDWDPQPPAPPKFTLVDQFSTGHSDVTPIPGAFSPVFNAMSAIEQLPVEFTLSDDVFVRIFDFVHDTVVSGAIKDEEFRVQGTTVCGVVSRLFSASCLALAIRIARIHSSFSNDSTGLSLLTIPELPVCIMDYIREIGEFTGPDGKSWLLHDFESVVKSLVRAANQMSDATPHGVVLSRLWLPTASNDGNTSFVVASRLVEYFRRSGFHLRVEDVLSSMFGGDIPPCVSSHLSALPFDHGAAVTRVFQTYSTNDQFIQMFSDDVGVKALALFNLTLGGTDANDLGFDMRVLRVATRLHRIWDSVQRSYAKTLGVVFARSTMIRPKGGGYHQVAVVRGVDSAYTVKSYYALTEEDLAFLSCYGNIAELGGFPMRFTRSGFMPSDAILSSIVCYDLGV